MLDFPPWKLALVFGVILLGILLALPNTMRDSTLGIEPLRPSEATPQALADYEADVAAAESSAWPGFLPRSKLNLGLDLRGGVFLLMEIDADEVAENRLQGVAAEIASVLNPSAERRIPQRTQNDGDRLVVNVANTGQSGEALNRIRRNVQSKVGSNQGGPDLLDIRELSGGRIEVRINESAKEDLVRDAQRRTLRIVRLRVDPDGVSEINVQPQGANRIILEAPGEPDPARLKDLLSQAGRLTFNLVDSSPSALEVALRQGPPLGREVLPGTDPRGQAYYLIESTPLVRGEDVSTASRGVDPDDNTPAVNFTLNGAGQKRFSNATQRNIGRTFAIILDGTVMSAPYIREPIYGNNVQITGSFTPAEADDLSAIIEAGELPAKLNFIQERTVGPTLGEDSIRAGSTASLIGLGLVAVFMIIAYGIIGTYAVLSLVTNIVLILGALSMLGATLTLPGIAGIILTIGMAVDANVLVFERIREEQRNGRSVMTAIAAGYERALPAILDANVTTFIAAAILYTLGSGPVKGFAVTLGIGILTSVFTAFVVTRLFTLLWVRQFRPRKLSI